MKVSFLIIAVCLLAVSCAPTMTSNVTPRITLEEANAVFRRIDRMWQLDYQRGEDAFRYRIVEADFLSVLYQVRKTFIDLGMPVQSEPIRENTIIAACDAPTPLTFGEWQKVVETENPRLKAVSNGWIYLPDNPSGYVITVAANLTPLKGKTLVVLEYKLDNPRLRQSGIRPNEIAPPLAVQIGSVKFWTQLEKRLSEANLPAPRERTEKEKVEI